MQKSLILNLKDNEYLAYNMSLSDSKDLVLFLGGFMSDKEGAKALGLEELCIENKISYIRFDYLGHGSSSGDFADYNISNWADNVIAIIDEVILKQGNKSIILVGSSMGGWLMLLAALKRKTYIKAIVGIASAPDFTEYLIWDQLSKDIQNQVWEKGVYYMENDYEDECDYPITRNLIKDGRNNLLLNQDLLAQLNMPVRLIHGMQDHDVPYSCSVQIMEKISSDDAKLTLVRNGDHRMSSAEDIKLIFANIVEVIENTKNNKEIKGINK